MKLYFNGMIRRENGVANQTSALTMLNVQQVLHHMMVVAKARLQTRIVLVLALEPLSVLPFKAMPSGTKLAVL